MQELPLSTDPPMKSHRFVNAQTQTPVFTEDNIENMLPAPAVPVVEEVQEPLAEPLLADPPFAPLAAAEDDEAEEVLMYSPLVPDSDDCNRYAMCLYLSH